MSAGEAIGAAATALAPFLQWAARELAPEETVTVTAAVRRYVAHLARTSAGFEAADADIDAQLADLEKRGK